MPECTIPKFSAKELNNPERVNEIVEELEQSKAEKIILLGDLPIKHFLSYFSDYRKLSDFGSTEEEYGKEHQIKINNKSYQVIPLVHPRQAAALGRSNLDWKKLHDWIGLTEQANELSTLGIISIYNLLLFNNNLLGDIRGEILPCILPWWAVWRGWQIFPFSVLVEYLLPKNILP